ncbi:HAD family hydrolase [Amycolatopsis rhabdoformis]|uniref:HAD family hydrolase n=1 Tax=Amycolatopsis rhabdoformis TaxID=1448059 RepID=A0ABZ1I2A1_9PSEU|nr:HAD family hydrolase [Amycolatopsis rhabdoformis]WSE27698.1 HAD family hydrolase [Amycolatopsis rhabdoformis]
MSITSILFDFSGTLFRLEQTPTWLSHLHNPNGTPLDLEAQTELMRRMTAPVGQVVELTEEYQHAWYNRDLDPALHRKVYLEVLRHSGVPDPAQATALYDRLITPSEWTPYPDTEAALKAAGNSVGILSNIAFDIRPAFTQRGWDAHIATFVLSFEVGAIKPQPEIFRTALDQLGARAEETLMIGDSEEADGGARALGCAFELVDPLPTAERPDALLGALRKHDVF